MSRIGARLPKRDFHLWIIKETENRISKSPIAFYVFWSFYFFLTLHNMKNYTKSLFFINHDYYLCVNLLTELKLICINYLTYFRIEKQKLHRSHYFFYTYDNLISNFSFNCTLVLPILIISSTVSDKCSKTINTLHFANFFN